MKKHNGIAVGILAVAMVMILSVGTSMGQWGSRSGDKTSSMPPPGPGQRPPPGPDPIVHHLIRCVDHLDVSSETRSTIDQLLNAHRDAQEQGRETMRAAMDAYWSALTASELDENALAKAKATLLSLRQQEMQSDFDLARSIRDLLSGDQLQELSACPDR